MERFWSKVKKGGPDECWEWQASRGSKGYGQAWWKPAGRAIGAHRVAYLLEHGQVPAGLQVAHTCHNKLCCNPAHLEAQTSADNNLANYRDGRHSAAKLSDWQVRFIWWLRLMEVAPKEIARAAEVPLWSVENVIYRRGRYLERIS